MAIRHRRRKKKRKEKKKTLLNARVLLALLRSMLMWFNVEHRVNMNIYSNMEMSLHVSLSTLDMRPPLTLN